MVKSVYVAGALTGASQNFKKFLEMVVLALETKLVVNRFFSLQVSIDPKIISENLYTFNDRQILKSDALVAFCDYPSTGGGMEIMIAHQAGKKIILLHKASLQPARMLLEFAELCHYPVLRYLSSDPLSNIVERILAKLKE